MKRTFEDLMQKARNNPEIKEFLDSEEVAISRKVFSKRMSLGLTQQQLADMAYVEVKMIHRIEGGDNGIKKDVYDKVFEALGINSY